MFLAMSQFENSLVLIVGTLMIISFPSSYCDGESLHNRGTIAYSHSRREANPQSAPEDYSNSNNVKSNHNNNNNVRKFGPVASLSSSSPALSPHTSIQKIEDENELHQIQDTETVTLLEQQQQQDVDEDSLAVVRLTHEKHHLWKLTMGNPHERDVKHYRNNLAGSKGSSSSSSHEDSEQREENKEPELNANSTSSVKSPAALINVQNLTALSNVSYEGEAQEMGRNDTILQNISDSHNSSSSSSSSSSPLLPETTTTPVLSNLRNAIVKEKPEGSQGAVVVASTQPKTVVGCPSCMLNSQLEESLSAQSIRKMRLEVIKEQILRKLGLKEPPNTTFIAKEQIPLPVAQGNILSKRRHPHLRNLDRDVDDFYGKTEQVIVFPEDVMPRCVTHRTDPSSCFTFKMPQDNKVDLVSTAELWVYKLQDERDGRNQSFWVDEVSLSPTDINHSAVRARNIDIKHDIPLREGWLKLNLTRMMPKWLTSNNSERALQIGCKTCAIGSYESPVDINGERRPFIVINFRSAPTKKRTRRNVNCSPDLSECCRESFVVSFREIGWDTWILAPTEYNAYYCKGSCVTINGIAHSSARHTTVMQRYIRTFGITNKTAELVPCCTAVKMSSIGLIYRDPNNLNHTVKQEILPNMVVDSCGCL